MALLQTDKLTKSFGALTAVSDVSLAIEAGSLHSIIGPNGAGKTTLFNLLTGTFPPTSGKIILDGKEITGTPAHRVAHLGLARSYQRTTVFPALSLLDNAWVAAFATGRSWRGLIWKNTNDFSDVKERALQSLKDAGLEGKAGQPARELSHGEQRQLEIGIALAGEPDLLLLDEPTSGMSPGETGRMIDLIASLPRTFSILMIEHDMKVVFSVADRITVLYYGEVLATGTPADIQANARVREVYLGVAH